MLQQFSHDDVELLGRELLNQGFFRLERFTLRHRLFGGGWSPPLRRELLLRRPAVALLPYDPLRDEVVLIEEFRVGALDPALLADDVEPAQRRQAASPWLIELVAGITEPDEPIEATAHREAHEEAGLTLFELLPIADYLSSAGGSDERLHLFCGRVDSSQAGGIHGVDHEAEDILVRAVARETAYGWVEQGLIRNAATLVALQWLQLNHARVRAQWQC